MTRQGRTPRLRRPRLPRKLWPPFYEAYPYSTVLAFWSLTAGPIVATGTFEPVAFNSARPHLEMGWGIVLTVAGIAVGLGLQLHRQDLRPLAYGLFGEAGMLIVFALSAIRSSGWHAAGATILLFLAIAAGCAGRAVQLLAKEMQQAPPKEDEGAA